MTTDVALQKRIFDIIDEYDSKVKNLDTVFGNYKDSITELERAVCVNGVYGNTHLNFGHIYEHQLNLCLKKSAWKAMYNFLQIDRIAPSSDKKRFAHSLEDPADFTFENVKATFGDYVADPFGCILRGLAEVFSSLDRSYRSHEKVKIGVDGLPKRIIINNVSDYGWGRGKIEDVLNALAAYQGKPLITHWEIDALLKDENALTSSYVKKDRCDVEREFVNRGVRLRRFANGNGHLFFEPDTLLDINKALASYYGEVLADCHEEAPTERKQSTEVTKDLAYYPTPYKVVQRIISDIYFEDSDKILEPSCGCGRFLDALAKDENCISRRVQLFGIEYDLGRANICREKGHNVMCANFLEVPAQQVYDKIIMNPPFVGKTYFKHIKHALDFLKNDGTLYAIVPATAFDHGLIHSLENVKIMWTDLPVGSFSESGTNVNTCIVRIIKR